MSSPAAATAAEPERVIFEGRPVALYSAGRWLLAVLTLGLAGVYFWAKAAALRVRITSERITIKRGLLGRTTDTLELYRVTDMQLREPFLERLVGCGRLVVTSSDRGQVTLEIPGLKGVESMANQVRQAVETQKLTRRVHTHQEA
ncbi:MAG: PH domain-containing protein [Deltaproteobacteria bacterium]|nr:PH domain-containing protein [Deltaproteobacteria bacterium]